MLRSGVRHDDSPFRVNKHDRVRCGLHDSPELLLSLLQLSQIPKNGIKAINFAALVSARDKINAYISSPGLLEKEVTLKAGALAPKCLLYVRLDSAVDFLAHYFPNREGLGLLRGQAKPLLKGHIAESVALVGCNVGERLRQRICDGSKALFSGARSFFCTCALYLFTSQTLARNSEIGSPSRQLIFPSFFFGPLAVLNVCTCAVPPKDASLLISKRIVLDQKPPIYSVFSAYPCFHLKRRTL